MGKALTVDGKYSDAYLLKAKIYSKLKSKKEALENFDQAIKFATYKKERYLLSKAEYYRSIGLFKDAILILNQSVELNSKFVSSLNLMAEIYFELDDFMQSELYLKKVLSLEPQNERAKKLREMMEKNK